MAASSDEAESAIQGALEDALISLEKAGIARERVVLGISDLPGDDGTVYVTHVGAAQDRDSAIMIEALSNDLKEEAGHQAMALFSEGACPGCGSVRYGPRHRVNSELRMERWDECLHCGRIDPR